MALRMTSLGRYGSEDTYPLEGRYDGHHRRGMGDCPSCMGRHNSPKRLSSNGLGIFTDLTPKQKWVAAAVGFVGLLWWLGRK